LPFYFLLCECCKWIYCLPNGLGFTRRHPPNCRWSTVTLNLGMIGGRVQAVLGAASRTSALPANRSPNLQSINHARIRFFIWLHAVLGTFQIMGYQPSFYRDVKSYAENRY
jgi:hypothetical protein